MIVYYFIFYSLYKTLRFLGNKDFPMFGAIGLISGSELLSFIAPLYFFISTT